MPNSVLLMVSCSHSQVKGRLAYYESIKGSGEVQGELFEDRITLGELVIEGQGIGVAQQGYTPCSIA